MSNTHLQEIPNQRQSRKQVWFAAVASTLGWSFDLFDLFILLYVAPELGKLFFPSSNPIISLAVVYASFAVTLLMRPLGSAIFGSYADRHGRKRAMTIATIGVGVSTALFGLLPTYYSIGVFATIIFIVLRLIQGVFVGGVVASTHTIGTESVPPKWRGLMAGIIISGGGIGSLFASIVYLIVSAMFPGPDFEVWGWRFMFFSGILSAALGLLVNKFLEESPYFKEHTEQVKKQGVKQINKPIRTLFTKYRSVMLVNIMIVIGGGSAYYLTSGYIPTFLKVINKISGDFLSLNLVVASVMAIIASVLVVLLSDIIGRKKTFIIFGALGAVGIPYLFMMLQNATTSATILWCVAGLAFLGNSADAPIIIFLNERFPTAIRASGTALCWNIGFAVGGIMPTFVTLASGSTANIPAMLGYFTIALFILFLIGSFIIPETKGQMDKDEDVASDASNPSLQIKLQE
jgi:MHS family proline/betaine transporter-like MFS transporter